MTPTRFRRIPLLEEIFVPLLSREEAEAAIVDGGSTGPAPGSRVPRLEDGINEDNLPEAMADVLSHYGVPEYRWKAYLELAASLLAHAPGRVHVSHLYYIAGKLAVSGE